METPSLDYLRAIIKNPMALEEIIAEFESGEYSAHLLLVHLLLLATGKIANSEKTVLR